MKTRTRSDKGRSMGSRWAAEALALVLLVGSATFLFASRLFASSAPSAEEGAGALQGQSWAGRPNEGARGMEESSAEKRATAGLRKPDEDIAGRETTVDLHIDPLLWHDDLLQAPKRQVDLERLEAGGIDLAVFGLVSAGLPLIGGWRLFTRWRGWPKEARRSRWAAVVDQIERLERFAERHPDRLRIGHRGDEIRAILAEGRIAAIFGLEGAHALEGDVSRLEALRDRGVWSVGPVHLSANALGGSSWPLGRRSGLSAYGRQVVKEAARLGMAIDLAHLSRDAFWDALDAVDGPVYCSHTGIAAVEPSWRNLDDAQLRAIAARGGIVGIMLATNFIGGRSIARWVEHVRHAVDVMGIEHVALGSDFDGFIPVPVDARDIGALPRLRAALLDAGFPPEDADRIMGANALGFILGTLDQRDAEHGD